jgi:hypothetical protein
MNELLCNVYIALHNREKCEHLQVHRVNRELKALFCVNKLISERKKSCGHRRESLELNLIQRIIAEKT